MTTTKNKLLIVMSDAEQEALYHQLRSTIAQVGGKKELTGRTDIEIEISNQCVRLIANAIIYHNSAILSHLLTKCQASGNTRALAMITRMSPRPGGTSC